MRAETRQFRLYSLRRAPAISGSLDADAILERRTVIAQRNREVRRLPDGDRVLLTAVLLPLRGALERHMGRDLVALRWKLHPRRRLALERSDRKCPFT